MSQVLVFTCLHADDQDTPRQSDSFWCRVGWQAVGSRPQICPPPSSPLTHQGHASASSGQDCTTCRSEEASRLAGCQPAAPMVVCRVVVVKLDVRTLFPYGVALCLSPPEEFAQKGYIRPICHMLSGCCCFVPVLLNRVAVACAACHSSNE